jgi:hypothetical protein
MPQYLLLGKITVFTYIDAENEDAAIEAAKIRSVEVGVNSAEHWILDDQIEVQNIEIDTEEE